MGADVETPLWRYRHVASKTPLKRRRSRQADQRNRFGDAASEMPPNRHNCRKLDTAA